MICLYSEICLQHSGNKIDERTTDETGGFQDLLLPLFLTSQVSEGVDDDTKDEVKNDNDYNEEEQEVVNHSGCEQRLLDGPVAGKTGRKSFFLKLLPSQLFNFIFHQQWLTQHKYHSCAVYYKESSAI